MHVHACRKHFGSLAATTPTKQNRVFKQAGQVLSLTVRIVTTIPTSYNAYNKRETNSTDPVLLHTTAIHLLTWHWV